MAGFFLTLILGWMTVAGAGFVDPPLAAHSSGFLRFAEREIVPGIQSASEGKLLKYVGKQVFPFEILDFDIGDLNGDGRKECALIDSHRLMVFRCDSGKFKPVAKFEVDEFNNRFIGLDVGDINGNGKDEVFITNKVVDRLGSFVLEAGRNGFKKIQDGVELYFRIIHPFGSPPRLLAQKPGLDRPFRDGIWIAQFRNRRYGIVRRLRLPENKGIRFLVYGLTRADLDADGKPDTVLLDDHFHLRVYSSSGSLVLKSDEYFGHDPRLIDIGIRDEFPEGTREAQPVHLRSRLILERFGKRKFLFIPKNFNPGESLLPRLDVVNNSRLVVLGVSAEGLERVFATKKQRGYIAGFQIMDSPEGNVKFVHVAVVRKGLGEKTSSTIFSYRWGE